MQDIYNPWSILKYIDDVNNNNKKQPEAYWANTSGNDIVKKLIKNADNITKNEIETLINGGTIEKTLNANITYNELNFLKRSNLKSCYAFLIGVFRRGNKPSVLPRDRKTSGATIERASLMRAERLKNKKNLVYNSSGLATALLEYRRFFK